MSRIFDNIQQELLSALRATLQVSARADFCVGYLNLRGWQAIDDLIAPWNLACGQVCRVLVGMQRPPQDEIRALYRQADEEGLIDNATATRLKTQFAAHLREQITLGIPSGKDEEGLRRLARQLRAGQVVVKLFLPYPLHAKLDGLVAHLYGLSEDEFAHILGTFPLVAEPVKVGALNAWRDVQKGWIQ